MVEREKETREEKEMERGIEKGKEIRRWGKGKENTEERKNEREGEIGREKGEKHRIIIILSLTCYK